jgi:hypothetical protein
MLDVCDDLVVHPQAQRDVERTSVEMKGTTKTTRIESCSAAVIPDRSQRPEADVKSISATCPGFGYAQRNCRVRSEPKLSFTRSGETALIISRYGIVFTQAFSYNRCGRGPTPDLDKACRIARPFAQRRILQFRHFSDD